MLKQNEREVTVSETGPEMASEVRMLEDNSDSKYKNKE